MVQVTVTASVSVKGGPTVQVNSTFDPEPGTTAYSSLEIEPAKSKNVPLLPAQGTPVLLAISAREANGKPAALTIKPTDSSGAPGDEIKIVGSLLVTNAAVLGKLVAGGAKGVQITNASTTAASVQIVAAVEEAATQVPNPQPPNPSPPPP